MVEFLRDRYNIYKQNKMANADISHVSEEEENYLRMDLLLTGISPRAVRALFDNEFHHSRLEATIKNASGQLLDLRHKRVINAEQWNLLFPSGGRPISTSFDFTLMVALLTNLTNLPTPTAGYDKLPPCTDTKPTDDIARIKYFRNRLAHSEDGKIDNASFSSDWENISGAVGRLGGPSMTKECKELRSKHLDQSKVPWNIKVQISQILDKWRNNDASYVQTTAATKVLENVQKNSCVTITASSGVGKTAILRHVVLKMADEGYDVLLVTNPQDIVKFYNPNQKTLFVIDDFCGTYSINQADLYDWELVMERIKELMQNKLTKVIVACRLQVYNDDKFKSLSMFTTNVCNLLSEDLRLSQAEKHLIAELYLKTEASIGIQYSNQFDCFPLLCKLYYDNPNFNITDFFQNPFSVYEAEIEQLKTNGDFGKYCALALCVMFNNELKKKVLTDEIDAETKTIIENTCEACRLEKGTPRLTLLNALDSLEHTFIKKTQGVYETVHSKLFEFLSYYFGKEMIQCLIKNANCKFINERFLFESRQDNDQFIIIVPAKYHQKYFIRMVDDWSKDEVVKVFCNKNMNSPSFREKFLCHLNTLEISYQKKLALTFDIDKVHNVPYCCILLRDSSLFKWAMYHRGNNIYDKEIDFSFHYKGVTQNYSDNVASPLQNEFNRGHCSMFFDENPTGASPLFTACEHNRVEIVKMLLDNDVDINKCREDETSPLFKACQKNHFDIVNMLLDKSADVNKCNGTGESPLFIACDNNHLDIVKLLLENHADIDKCRNDDTSPLYEACRQNHIQTVKLLLEHKADINKCTKNGTSPLFTACENNYVDIVKLLLDNKADNNMCTDIGTSPLNIAFQRKHLDIVKLFLDNKANINKCSENGPPPLMMACAINCVDTVKMLLENNIDINCTFKGITSLFMACQCNHVDIVHLLLDNKADINKFVDKGAPPLYIACQNNHANIVRLLLDNKADINKCSTNGSPILVACNNGHINIVKILLEYGVNYNECSMVGSYWYTPTQIAAKNGHIDIATLIYKHSERINFVCRNMKHILNTFKDIS